MKAAFLDRDGVINQDSGYVYRKEDFVFCDRVVDALRILQDAGYLLIIVTNQSGIGRGYYTEEDYQRLTQWYLQELKQSGVIITDVFHCPDSPEVNSDCRKPKPGMILSAAKKYSVDLSASLLVGDKLSDIQAAEAAGISSAYLIDNPQYPQANMTNYADLYSCVIDINL